MAIPSNIADPQTGEKARVIENQAIKVTSDFNDSADRTFSIELGYNSEDELIRITRKHGVKEYYRTIDDDNYVGNSIVVRTKEFGRWNEA